MQIAWLFLFKLAYHRNINRENFNKILNDFFNEKLIIKTVWIDWNFNWGKLILYFLTIKNESFGVGEAKHLSDGLKVLNKINHLNLNHG
jgi:hypothetical protein